MLNGLQGDELRALQSFRKRPEAKILRVVLERNMAQARKAYESTVADEKLRGTITAHKDLLNALFDSPITDEV